MHNMLAHGVIKIGQLKVGNDACLRLDFCCKIEMVGSAFGIKKHESLLMFRLI